MKNTSTIGHSGKHTFLPTTTFLGSRTSVCPRLRVPIPLATAAALWCHYSLHLLPLSFLLQVLLYKSFKKQIFLKEKKVDDKLGGCSVQSAVPLWHAQRSLLFWDSANNTVLRTDTWEVKSISPSLAQKRKIRKTSEVSYCVHWRFFYTL